MFLSACLLVSFVAQSVGLVVGAAMNVQVNVNFYFLTIYGFCELKTLFYCRTEYS